MNHKISENAHVYDSAHVAGAARVYDSAHVGGSARVYDSARVFGSARVYDSAHLSGDGRIEKTSDYLCLGPAISSGRITTAHRDAKIGVRIHCGCFSGSLAEFRAQIAQTHAKGTPARHQYELFADVIDAHFALIDRADDEKIERA